ncbi:hypothetical protein BJ741DRAFT_616645 [Chytriomyces cf. hyalinus JEL632]|nr:hypothetical protein BJ741DRAFT_616645 [Chytriomyces cf. hyalinus JEL632]
MQAFDHIPLSDGRMDIVPQGPDLEIGDKTFYYKTVPHDYHTAVHWRKALAQYALAVHKALRASDEAAPDPILGHDPITTLLAMEGNEAMALILSRAEYYLNTSATSSIPVPSFPSGYAFMLYAFETKAAREAREAHQTTRIEKGPFISEAGMILRVDPYLYGHPAGRSHRFRSSVELKPHIIWLLWGHYATNEAPTPVSQQEWNARDVALCHCKYCPYYIARFEDEFFLPLTRPMVLQQITKKPRFDHTSPAAIFRLHEYVWVRVLIMQDQDTRSRKTKVAPNVFVSLIDEATRPYGFQVLTDKSVGGTVTYWPCKIVGRKRELDVLLGTLFTKMVKKRLTDGSAGAGISGQEAAPETPFIIKYTVKLLGFEEDEDSAEVDDESEHVLSNVSMGSLQPYLSTPPPSGLTLDEKLSDEDSRYYEEAYARAIETIQDVAKHWSPEGFSAIMFGTELIRKGDVVRMKPSSGTVVENVVMIDSFDDSDPSNVRIMGRRWERDDAFCITMRDMKTRMQAWKIMDDVTPSLVNLDQIAGRLYPIVHDGIQTMSIVASTYWADWAGIIDERCFMPATTRRPSHLSESCHDDSDVIPNRVMQVLTYAPGRVKKQIAAAPSSFKRRASAPIRAPPVTPKVNTSKNSSARLPATAPPAKKGENAVVLASPRFRINLSPSIQPSQASPLLSRSDGPRISLPLKPEGQEKFETVGEKRKAVSASVTNRSRDSDEDTSLEMKRKKVKKHLSYSIKEKTTATDSVKSRNSIGTKKASLPGGSSSTTQEKTQQSLVSRSNFRNSYDSKFNGGYENEHAIQKYRIASLPSISFHSKSTVESKRSAHHILPSSTIHPNNRNSAVNSNIRNSAESNSKNKVASVTPSRDFRDDLADMFDNNSDDERGAIRPVTSAGRNTVLSTEVLSRDVVKSLPPKRHLHSFENQASSSSALSPSTQVAKKAKPNPDTVTPKPTTVKLYVAKHQKVLFPKPPAQALTKLLDDYDIASEELSDGIPPDIMNSVPKINSTEISSVELVVPTHVRERFYNTKKKIAAVRTNGQFVDILRHIVQLSESGSLSKLVASSKQKAELPTSNHQKAVEKQFKAAIQTVERHPLSNTPNRHPTSAPPTKQPVSAPPTRQPIPVPPARQPIPVLPTRQSLPVPPTREPISFPLTPAVQIVEKRHSSPQPRLPSRTESDKTVPSNTSSSRFNGGSLSKSRPETHSMDAAEMRQLDYKAVTAAFLQPKPVAVPVPKASVSLTTPAPSQHMPLPFTIDTPPPRPSAVPSSAASHPTMEAPTIPPMPSTQQPTEASISMANKKKALFAKLKSLPRINLPPQIMQNSSSSLAAAASSSATQEERRDYEVPAYSQLSTPIVPAPDILSNTAYPDAIRVKEPNIPDTVLKSEEQTASTTPSELDALPTDKLSDTQLESSQNPEPAPGAPSMFVCNMEGCQRSYSTLVQLSRHQNSKWLVCPIPGCTFKAHRSKTDFAHRKTHAVTPVKTDNPPVTKPVTTFMPASKVVLPGPVANSVAASQNPPAFTCVVTPVAEGPSDAKPLEPVPSSVASNPLVAIASDLPHAPVRPTSEEEPYDISTQKVAPLVTIHSPISKTQVPLLAVSVVSLVSPAVQAVSTIKPSKSAIVTPSPTGKASESAVMASAGLPEGAAAVVTSEAKMPLLATLITPAKPASAETLGICDTSGSMVISKSHVPASSNNRPLLPPAFQPIKPKSGSATPIAAKISLSLPGQNKSPALGTAGTELQNTQHLSPSVVDMEIETPTAEKKFFENVFKGAEDARKVLFQESKTSSVLSLPNVLPTPVLSTAISSSSTTQATITKTTNVTGVNSSVKASSTPIMATTNKQSSTAALLDEILPPSNANVPSTNQAPAVKEIRQHAEASKSVNLATVSMPPPYQPSNISTMHANLQAHALQIESLPSSSSSFSISALLAHGTGSAPVSGENGGKLAAVPFVCGVEGCTRSYPTLAALAKHKNGKQLLCQQACGFTAHRAQTIYIHCKEVHGIQIDKIVKR